MKIEELQLITAQDVDAFARLMAQLSQQLSPPSQEQLRRIVDCPMSHLVVARSADGMIVGVLTLAIYDAPSGRKAWIEDVVTDTTARGKGIGRRLVEAAVEIARREGVAKICLTSNPSRVAAHALYAACGFTLYDTDVFVMKL